QCGERGRRDVRRRNRAAVPLGGGGRREVLALDRDDDVTIACPRARRRDAVEYGWHLRGIRRRRNAADGDRSQVGAIEAVQVHATGDAWDGSAARVLPEGPAEALPVVRR